MVLQRNLKIALSTSIFIALLTASETVAQAQVLFFSTGAGIEYSDLDGSNRKAIITIVGSTTRMIDLAVDSQSRMVYWALYDSMLDEVVFLRAATNSKRPEELFRVANGSDFRAIAVDGIAGKIYWARSLPTNTIQRANLDGSNSETVLENLKAGLIALIVEPEFNEMYWTSYTNYQTNGTIHRATLDGENIEAVVTEQGWPTGFAIDRAGGKIYWADYFHRAVNRADLADGSNMESLVGGIGKPIGIAIDPQAGKVYWVDTIVDKVRWANLNGTDVSNVTNVASARFLGILLKRQVSISETSWGDIRQRYR